MIGLLGMTAEWTQRTALTTFTLSRGGVGAGGEVPCRGIVSFLVIAVLQVTMAAGFGALSAQTAVAVAAYLVAPTVWAAVGNVLLKSNAQWLDVFSAFARLASTHPLTDLPHSLTAIGFWIVLPTTIGVVRSLTREVK